jgi:hypothetical protein
LTFLDTNDRILKASDDELFDFVIGVVEGPPNAGDQRRDPDADVERIRVWLGAHVSTRKNTVSGMTMTEFLKCVSAAGGSNRVSSGTWIIKGPQGGKGIRVSQATRRLDGQAIKKYLKDLGLSAGQTGVYYDEFKAGVGAEQQVMIRFRNVLKRLAHA